MAQPTRYDPRRSAYLANAPLLTRTLDAPGATITLDQLQGIEIPLCVVTGGASVSAGRAVARLLVEALIDVRPVELPDVGHATYVDAPDQFAETTATFAQRVVADHQPELR